jgi:RNA polymerase sigma-70 factor, ECF subfamily
MKLARARAITSCIPAVLRRGICSSSTRPSPVFALPARSDGATIVLVSTDVRIEDASAAAAATLGDLLYAFKPERHATEEEWVGLVRAIATGDQRALQSLYGRTHRIVFTLIMRIIKNRDTAEELTLDVFHDVWRRADRFDASGGTVVGWIMNQARSRAIDRARFERRKKRVNPHPLDADAGSDLSSPEETLDGEERGRVVRDALAVALTPKEREAIETAYFFEYTYAQVAARLNQPLGTVKTRIRSGMAKLRRALAAAERIAP